MKINHSIRFLCGTFTSFGLIASAIAGPGPHEIYKPASTVARTGKIERRIQNVSVYGDGTETFVMRRNAHGGTQGEYVYDDAPASRSVKGGILGGAVPKTPASIPKHGTEKTSVAFAGKEQTAIAKDLSADDRRPKSFTVGQGTFTIWR